jgi:hypothetical protein
MRKELFLSLFDSNLLSLDCWKRINIGDILNFGSYKTYVTSLHYMSGKTTNIIIGGGILVIGLGHTLLITQLFGICHDMSC